MKKYETPELSIEYLVLTDVIMESQMGNVGVTDGDIDVPGFLD